MQVIQDFGVNGSFPSTVGGLGSTIKYFGRNVAFNAGASWTSPLVPSTTNAKGLMLVPGDNKLNGQPFDVVASGDFTPGAAAGSETVTLVIQAVTGTLASPVYTTLASSGAFAPGVDGIAYNFLLKASLLGSNNSGIVGGVQLSLVNNTYSAAAALANSLTGISFGVSGTSPNQVPGALGGPFGLVVGVTFSGSNALNAANLYQFSLSA